MSDSLRIRSTRQNKGTPGTKYTMSEAEISIVGTPELNNTNSINGSTKQEQVNVLEKTHQLQTHPNKLPKSKGNCSARCLHCKP